MTKQPNIVELLNQYHKSPITQKLRDKFLTPSLFDIIQKDRSETVHSNFLAWLFDMQRTNGIEGFNIISSLLQVAFKRANEQNKQGYFPIDIVKAAYGNPNSIQISRKVRREYRCPGVYYTGKTGKSKSGQEGIVDLVIDGTFTQGNENINTKIVPFKIIIENKVDTGEHDLQTWKYYTYFEGETCDMPEDICQKGKVYAKPDDEQRIYIFLTPDTTQVDPECPYFIWINYQDIMDSCIIPLLQSSRLDPRSRMFLEEYSRALSLPYINNIGKTIIMSLDPLDASLLKEFWEANQTLITMSLQALGESSPEMSEEVKETLDAINGLEGKRKKYVIKHITTGDTKQTNQSNLMFDLMGMYINHNINNSVNTIEKNYDLTSIFCTDPKKSGYSKDWLNINGMRVRVTNQKPRTPEQLEKIRTQAERDGFIIE